MRVTRNLILALIILNILCEAKSSDFQEFLIKLPDTVGETISNTWNSIINAVKRPMRLNRRKRKKRKQISTTTETTVYSGEIFTESNIFNKIDYIRPTIPVFYQPKWSQRFDWTSFERPSLVQIIERLREIKTSTTEKFDIKPYQKVIWVKSKYEDNDNHIIGGLYFI